MWFENNRSIILLCQQMVIDRQDKMQQPTLCKSKHHLVRSQTTKRLFEEWRNWSSEHWSSEQHDKEKKSMPVDQWPSSKQSEPLDCPASLLRRTTEIHLLHVILLACPQHLVHSTLPTPFPPYQTKTSQNMLFCPSPAFSCLRILTLTIDLMHPWLLITSIPTATALLIHFLIWDWCHILHFSHHNASSSRLESWTITDHDGLPRKRNGQMAGLQARMKDLEIASWDLNSNCKKSWIWI